MLILVMSVAAQLVLMYNVSDVFTVTAMTAPVGTHCPVKPHIKLRSLATLHALKSYCHGPPKPNAKLDP